MEKLRIGVIGTGFAKNVQIPSFLKTGNAEIVSVASANLEKARQTAEQFSIKHFTNDWRETASHKDVDLVCVTTPPIFHEEMTLFSLEHEKHVLCEKPMAMNAEQAKKMLEKAQEKAHLLCLIDHELRFQNGRKIAYKLIRDGQIGKIRHIKYNFRAPHRGNPELPWNWWYDESQGGGVLGAIVSHVFDSIRWFSGAEVCQVFCQLQTHIKQRRDNSGLMRKVTSDDEANLILRLTDNELTEDATVNISSSMVEYPIYQNRIEIFGSRGSLRIEFDGRLFIGKPEKEEWQAVEVELDERLEGVKNTGWGDAFLAFAKVLVKSLISGERKVEGAATFEDGYKVQLILDAAKRSNQIGCAVKV
ncbi:MAG: Gfo/Idh/MocA family oxidoreductase [Pyrinomonadaceae bacterium]|nr:Gfo/Idh/MocA family oxidoreductase [Pyrinomonadaceae bacterium]MCX7638856.1 Gfo/Idh/MocA family oxidoreductase [Pyrinomonadaceae bacterium]MDW8305008.1 Gfo/Idh/MocA family oxidoreductase [Acidobacteriota bacterium]